MVKLGFDAVQAESNFASREADIDTYSVTVLGNIGVQRESP